MLGVRVDLTENPGIGGDARGALKDPVLRNSQMLEESPVAPSIEQTKGLLQASVLFYSAELQVQADRCNLRCGEWGSIHSLETWGRLLKALRISDLKGSRGFTERLGFWELWWKE